MALNRKSKRKVHLIGVMMVKNEEKRIHVSLASLKPLVERLAILDTGSTDSTINIIKKWCRENSKDLDIWEDGWVDDFGYSRSFLLNKIDGSDWSGNPHTWLLLLDCNDEMRYMRTEDVLDHGTNTTRKKLLNYLKLVPDDISRFMVRQRWFTGVDYLDYRNSRLIRPRRGWRYEEPVHESMYSNTDSNTQEGKLKEWIIYQDRTQDDDKSQKRFLRDEQILLRRYSDLKDDRDSPKLSRTVYYLAQTYDCIPDHRKALEWHLRRSTLEGFYEEKWISIYKVGHYYEKMGKWPLAEQNYLAAWKFQPRCEPLVSLAKHYRDKENWRVAWSWLKLALELKYPFDAGLWVEKEFWNYERYHLMGIIAFYYDRPNDGIEAIKILIATNRAQQQDLENLKHYQIKKSTPYEV